MGHELERMFFYIHILCRLDLTVVLWIFPAEPQQEDEAERHRALEQISPLLRVLPQYEQRFIWHVRVKLTLHTACTSHKTAAQYFPTQAEL